jgi:hypothetical protein
MNATRVTNISLSYQQKAPAGTIYRFNWMIANLYAKHEWIGDSQKAGEARGEDLLHC